MSCRTHRYHPSHGVNSGTQTLVINSRKMVLEFFFGDQPAIKPHTLIPRVDHFSPLTTTNNVPRCQLAQRIILKHETLSKYITQYSSCPSHGFRNKKGIIYVLFKQGCRMK